MNVFDVINNNLASNYSMHKYVTSQKTWDTMKAGLLALVPKGTAALQLSGRFDIMSQKLYGTAQLAWMLMIYNSVRQIGYEEGRLVHKSVGYTLDAYEVVNSDINLVGQTIEVLSTVATVEQVLAKKTINEAEGAMYFDLETDGTNEIMITQSQNTTRIENLSATQQSITLAYAEMVYSDYLSEGTLMSYPSKEDVDNLLNEVLQQAKLTDRSVNRL